MKKKKQNCVMRRFVLANELIRNLVKDFKTEFRNRIAVNITFAFAGIVTLSISLVIGGVPIPVKIQAILLWIILFFSAMNGLAHVFTREEEQGTSLFLTLNSSVNSIFGSKLIFNLIFFFAIEAIVAPLFIFFLQVEVKVIHIFVLSIITGGIAISSATTILAAMVAKSGGKGSLFTVISFPILLPVLWVSTVTTISSLEGKIQGAAGNLVFLTAFSGLVLAVSFVLFRFVWLEE